jgi:hypothetical protein
MLNWRCLLAGLALAGAALGEVQEYDKVITKEAKTRVGIFKVHQVGDKYFYEIPKAELDKEFLWNTRISRTTFGVGAGGTMTADRVVRWHLNGNRVVLLDVNYQATAEPGSPVAAAVAAANNATVLMSFEVAALGSEGEPVIETGRLFTTDVAEFGLKQRLGATFLDAARTWVERITPFPQNIEAEATQTWVRNDASSPAGQMKPGSATVVVHHSMVKLPEQPMRPRLYDDRVGFFPAFQLDYSRDETRARNTVYICRWRLDKPIVYYIDAATPVKWREWIRKGVESWLPAFQEAGFPHAIEVRNAPEPNADPDFSPEDIRYSVIRWMASPTENAFGPNIHDPRTGEILNADIEFNQNMLKTARLWYVTQIGMLDPRVKSLPLPDEVTGEMIRYLIAHEVGHTLGLEHNLKASSMYPADKVHDREWVHKMGFTPSVMDYARYNYVAQPEDGIPVEDLQPRVGPYDVWTLRWGYTPIPHAKTVDDEKPVLNKWAEEQS